MTGGVTPKNIGLIEGPDSEFMRSYLDKGRVRPLLDKVPLFAVMTEDLGVRGAHKAAVLVRVKFIPPRALHHADADQNDAHTFAVYCVTKRNMNTSNN
jgi:hypothetical protein